MKYINYPGTDMRASQIALGCMRIKTKTPDEIVTLINTAVELGINFLDIADIYGKGVCEELLGEALALCPGLRSKVLIQSKCGIRPGFFDFSKEHILTSVDNSLRKMKTDCLDVLLLHRPDTLMEPEEVAEAFTALHKKGKVKYFGVSNHNPMQIELLQKFIKQRLIINQLQFSITNTTMIKAGINVNMENEAAVNRDGSVLEYCRLKDITIQNWSPFQHGFFKGVFLDNENFPELNEKINALCEKYGVTNSAMAIAWILRHPAKMQPVVGTTSTERLTDIAKAAEVDLTREEWYSIYLSAGNKLP